MKKQTAPFILLPTSELEKKTTTKASLTTYINELHAQYERTETALATALADSSCVTREFIISFPNSLTLTAEITLSSLIIDGVAIPAEQILNIVIYGVKQKLADYYAKYKLGDYDSITALNEVRLEALRMGLKVWEANYWTQSDKTKAENQAAKATPSKSSKPSGMEIQKKIFMAILNKQDDEATKAAFTAAPMNDVISFYSESNPTGMDGIVKQVTAEINKEQEDQRKEEEAKKKNIQSLFSGITAK